jgi:lipid II:glycine glycyltransferase (peptidoglycan interpeptide bridge formation enzyme)
LQSWEWGEFKLATGGWRPLRLAFRRRDTVVAMASVAIRQLGPLRVMYAAKGPALDYADDELFAAVMDELERRAQRLGTVWLKIDPDVALATGLPESADDRPGKIGESIRHQLRERGWRFSDSQVQFRNTILVDLRRSEDELLMAMSGNTRRKVRMAEKRGVSVRLAGDGDLPTLFDLYKMTAERDNFLIRDFEYYRRAWGAFLRAGLAQALIAEVEGAAIAQVILFHFGRKCWYFYGASSNQERQRMPNYLLQWEALKWAKARGYAEYDMWGAPDIFTEDDSMWGVYQFKRGFRGQLTRHIGAWDYVPYPWLYQAYQAIAPRLMRQL